MDEGHYIGGRDAPRNRNEYNQGKVDGDHERFQEGVEYDDNDNDEDIDDVIVMFTAVKRHVNYIS